MLTFLLSLFGSSGFGSLLGALGGLANRLIDLKSKSLEFEQQLKLRDKDKELLVVEIEGKAKVATIEGEATIEAAAYNAMAASYASDKATYGIPAVDFIRGVIRPLLTVLIGGFALYVNYVILQELHLVWPELDQSTHVKIVMISLEWVFFQAGIVIGWWFANRPSNQQLFKGV